MDNSVEARLQRIEETLPSLATQTDLKKLERQLEKAIYKACAVMACTMLLTLIAVQVINKV